MQEKWGRIKQTNKREREIEKDIKESEKSFKLRKEVEDEEKEG